MELNEDCVRDVLKHLKNELKIGHDNNKCYFLQITLKDLIDDFKDIYLPEEIWYTIYNLNKANLIEGTNLDNMSYGRLDCQTVYNITYKGLQFVGKIEADTTWNKTKSIIAKVGNHTLNFIESTAHDIAVESAKQFITISMTGTGKCNVANDK